MSRLADRDSLRDFAPLAERALSVDGDALIRFRSGGGRIAGFVRLPYEVLAGRTLEAPVVEGSSDITVSAKQFLVWLDGDGDSGDGDSGGGGGGQPAPADAHWLSGLPPRAGWRRIERVPDTAIREVVRSGALLAAGTDTRPGQQALLDSIVLTAQPESGPPVRVPLGALSGLTRMGFLPRGGEAAVDTAPGWIRLAAAYGSTYVSDGKPLGLLSL